MSKKVSDRIDLFNTLSGVVFIIAVLLTVTFAVVNSVRIEDMTTEKKVITVPLQKSQPTNSFQKPSPQPVNQTNQNQQPKK